MNPRKPIGRLTIRGFKSIRNLDDFELGNLNVLIGPNGSGKSNLISFFHMLGEYVRKRLQIWTRKQGGANRIVTYGVKETGQLVSQIRFGNYGYHFELHPTNDDSFVIVDERVFDGEIFPEWFKLNSGTSETVLQKEFIQKPYLRGADCCYESMQNVKVYHFHDTGDSAAVKRPGSLHDYGYLRPDGSNLAAYLYYLKESHPEWYGKIRKAAGLAMPFFRDFVLKPRKLDSGEEQIALLWNQHGSDYPFWPSQMSDGSLRFIGLATALLQPDPPSAVVIDEPELGLHPYAIHLLGALLRSNANRMQIIVSTQSVRLLNEFAIKNLIVTERVDGVSVFRRLKEDEFADWLQEYGIGELWEKNILGGRP